MRATAATGFLGARGGTFMRMGVSGGEGVAFIADALALIGTEDLYFAKLSTNSAFFMRR